MISFRTPRRLLLTRALSACALIAAAPAVASASPLGAASATPAVAPTAVRAGSPITLHIPTAGIAAPIEQVWLTTPATPGIPAAPQAGVDRLALHDTQAEIGLPSSPDAVGWFALGAIPGEPGSALLVGHVDTISGPAVFTRLPRLQVGAEIVLELEGSSPRTFVLDEVRRHPAHLPAPAELFTLDGPSRLHLVTCTGAFVRASGGYQDRLILSASFVPPAPSEEALQSS